MFNKSVNNGFTFGNQNTSTPTSTPAQPANSLQFPQKSTGLFGNVNTNANTSTPSPSGGLFNSNSNVNSLNQQPVNNSLFGNKPTQSSGGLFNGANNTTSKSAGGLFGNSNFTANPAGSTGNNPTGSTATNGSLFGNNINTASNPSTGGLFSNNNSNTTSTAQSGGLFGRPAPTSVGTGSLFGNPPATNSSTGLFGSNNTQGSTNLFGQKPGLTTAGAGLLENNSVKFMQPGNTPGSMSTNPYGINISNIPVTVANMPKSITSSLPDGSGNADVTPKPTENRRTYSFSSTNSGSAPLPHVSQSSLVSRLGTRLKTTQKSATPNELFSPSYSKPWLSATSSNSLLGDFSSSKTALLNSGEHNNFNTNGFSFLSSQKTDLSELRKLKIDSNRSAAKKLKLLSGSPATTRDHVQDEPATFKDEPIANTNKITNNYRTEDENGDNEGPTLNGKDQSNDSNTRRDGENTVPEIPQDDDYWCSPPPGQLEHLSLKQLTSVPNFVIGRRGYGCITFKHEVDLTAFVRNFREELFGKTVIFRSSKTVEVYPDEANKPMVGYGLNVPAIITLENVYPVDKKTKRPMKDTSKFTEFQILDRKLRNMREMDFISYNPFGGLWTFKVNHFSIWGLVDEEDAEVDEEDLRNGKEEVEYPSKKVRTLAQSKPSDEDVIFEANSAFGSLTNKEDSIVEEKAYEPDVSEADFEGIEICPTLDISKDWVEQLTLAGSSLRSVFATSKGWAEPCKDEIDLLFTEFNDEIEEEKRIMKERRFTAPYTFAKFSTGSMLLMKDVFDKTGVSIHRLPNELKRDFLLDDLYLNKQMEKVTIELRGTNSYPQVSESSLLFKDILNYMKKPSSDYNLWKISSILFDPLSCPYEVHNGQAKIALLKRRRHRQLTSWIVSQITVEVEEKIKSSSNKIEQIFLHLMLNDVVSASKLAIESRNGHLSVLISYLGSNDPRIRDLAKLQLQKWSTGGSTVDRYVSRIYKLLSGSPFEGLFSLKELENEFSWLCLLNLSLCYGEVDEFSLEALVQSHLDRFSLPYDDPIGVIFELYAANENTEKLYKDVRQKTKALDVQFCWYLIQTLRFNKIRVFSDETSDEATFAFAAQLEFAQQHSHSLFVSCFLINDAVAKDNIKRLVTREITLLQQPPNNHILKKLKVPPELIFNAEALNDRYEGNYLSEVQNLLKGSSYGLAEKTILTALGPRLVLLNEPIENDKLKALRDILNEFPDSEKDKWNVSMKVFEDYLKFVLDNVETSEITDSLINGMKIYFEENKHNREVPACCNIMSKKIISNILKTDHSIIGDLKDKLLGLPLGQPEKAYLKNESAKI